MPTPTRPTPVGNYEVLQDFESVDASIRVIEMGDSSHTVGPHVHLHSTQTYLALEGTVSVTVDGVETVIRPYECVHVPVGARHATRPVGGRAVIANISVPPLRVDDQLAAAPASAPHDLVLPSDEMDVDD